MKRQRCSHSLKSGKRCSRYVSFNESCWQHSSEKEYSIDERHKIIKKANKELEEDKLKYNHSKKRTIKFVL